MHPYLAQFAPRTRGAVLIGVLLTSTLFVAGPAAGDSQASPSDATYPAKLEVLRAGIDQGRLDVLAEITRRADGDRIRAEFIAGGQRYSFTERVRDGRILFKRKLPPQQRRMDTGIMDLRYAGNERVRPIEVRLRAANAKARLERDLLSLEDGVLTARGSLTGRANGVVRLQLGFARSDGTSGEWQGRAEIQRDGSWALEERLPAEARQGGYLSIQFTGYYPRRIRGEQIAKQLLDGQSFGLERVPSTDPNSPNPPVSAPPPPPPTSSPSDTAPVHPPAPSSGKVTAWRAPGSPPLSDAEAASRVRSAAEVRPGNVRQNNYRPAAEELDRFRNGQVDWYGRTAIEYNPLTGHVTGGFSGTTDEILQWVAHKWGIPEDLVRAIAVNESHWSMSHMGDRFTVSAPDRYPAQARISGTSDVYQSMGIMQVRWTPEGLHTGTEPLRWKSTAFNADYWAAVVRYYYDGLCYWCEGDYRAGQEWESVGAWYNPYPWGGGATAYIEKAKSHMTQRTWAEPWF